MTLENKRKICADQIINQYSDKVAGHYDRVLKSLASNEYEGLKILVFQPVSAGDIIVSSLCGELFQIKYPGCTVDYMVDPCCKVAKQILETNPFINNVIIEGDWNKYQRRDTLETGEIKEKYDIAYSLYWWDMPMVESYLKDLELPTDYTRVKIYVSEENDQIAKELWHDLQHNDTFISYNICLQSDMNTKWDGNYKQLLRALEDFGPVIEIGRKERSLGLDAALLQNADFFVGPHSGLEHLAAAVGCQCVVLSDIRPPECASVASYQNKYLSKDRQHITIRPVDWCGDYKRCLCWNPNEFMHKLPPHGFPNHFPCHVARPCDYKNFKTSCVHEISVELIIENVKKAIELRNS